MAYNKSKDNLLNFVKNNIAKSIELMINKNKKISVSESTELNDSF